MHTLTPRSTTTLPSLPAGSDKMTVVHVPGCQELCYSLAPGGPARRCQRGCLAGQWGWGSLGEFAVGGSPSFEETCPLSPSPLRSAAAAQTPAHRPPRHLLAAARENTRAGPCPVVVVVRRKGLTPPPRLVFRHGSVRATRAPAYLSTSVALTCLTRTPLPSPSTSDADGDDVYTPPLARG